jgi:ferredoxin
MDERVRITVDHNLCVGSAMCSAVAPEIFRLNDDRQAEVIPGVEVSRDRADEAADNCPVGAITVEEEPTS